MELKKELKYPVKYAVMPIFGQTGRCSGLNELEKDCEVVAYIASKCYVVGERKEYLSDGSFIIKYEVVFSHAPKNTGASDEFKKVIPEYDFYSQCINSITVNELFDNFEEAALKADHADREILGRQIRTLSYGKDFIKRLKEIKDMHQEVVDRCKKIEETIERENSDMKVLNNGSFMLEEIIKRIYDYPCDFYTKVASVLSEEEREFLMQLIKNKSCLNCTNENCRLEQSERVRLNELGKLRGSNCPQWDNPELIGKQRVLFK